MDEWMKEMFGDTNPEDLRPWMEGLGSMVEQWCGAMDTEQTAAWMEEWLPRMMEWCFSCLDTDERERMLGLCREMLDKIESEGSSPEASSQ